MLLLLATTVVDVVDGVTRVQRLIYPFIFLRFSKAKKRRVLPMTITSQTMAVGASPDAVEDITPIDEMELQDAIKLLRRQISTVDGDSDSIVVASTTPLRKAATAVAKTSTATTAAPAAATTAVVDSVTTNNDKVGLLIFTDQVELYIPPRKGRRPALHRRRRGEDGSSLFKGRKTDRAGRMAPARALYRRDQRSQERKERRHPRA